MNNVVKLFYLASIIIILNSNINCGKLTVAINNLDVKEVERLLREKNSLSETNRHKLIAIIKKNIKLFQRTICQFTKFSKLKPKRKIDFAKSAIGLICALSGAIIAYLAIDSLKIGWKKKQLLEQYISEPCVEPFAANSIRARRISYWDLIDYEKDISIGFMSMAISSALLTCGLYKLYCSYKIYSTLSKLEKIHQIKKLIKNVSLNNKIS